jgi:hypothetical protein
MHSYTAVLSVRKESLVYFKKITASVMISLPEVSYSLRGNVFNVTTRCLHPNPDYIKGQRLQSIALLAERGW